MILGGAIATMKVKAVGSLSTTTDKGKVGDFGSTSIATAKVKTVCLDC